MLGLKITAVLLIIYLVTKMSRWLKNRARLVEAIEKLPGPPTVPFIPFMGHTIVTLYVDLLNHKQGTYEILYGMLNSLNTLYPGIGIARLWLGLRPVVFLYSAETVESVLTSTTVINKAIEYSVFKPFLGEGLVTSGKAKWRFRRKILTPAFHFRILNDFIPTMNSESTKLIRKLNQNKYLNPNDKPFDIVPLIILCTLDTICETAMGTNINSQADESNEYAKALHQVGEMALARVVRPWLRPDFIYYRSIWGKKFIQARDKTHEFTKKVILERKSEWESHQASLVARANNLPFNKTTDIKDKSNEFADEKTMEAVRESSFFASKNRRLAFLDLLLYQHLTAKTMSLADIQEEVDTFMFAGHDTTAMSISWTIYMLGLHEDIQEKCRDELDSIFKEDTFEHIDDTEHLASKLITTDITNEHLNEMRYLDRVIKESNRIYPPIPFVAREVTEDIMVAGKYLVPKGATCVVLTHSLHANPMIFPKPEVFDPDRFLPENAPNNIFAYIPFSAGPRNCIGQKFAQKEQKIILTKVIRNYHIKTYDQRDKLSIVGELVLRSRHGLHVKFTPRFKCRSE